MFTPQHCPVMEIKAQLPLLYDISENCSITLLKYSENLTYLVEDTEGTRFVLRLNRPSYHTDSELNGELLWIHRLAEDTNIPLASVITSRNGNLTEHLAFRSGVCCTCSLFEFLNGSTLHDIHGEQLYIYMEKIGAITAQLHNHVSNWKESGSLDRFTWDWDDLFGSNARWGDWSALPLLSSEQHKIVERAVEIIKKRIAAYGKNSSNYGLIHSDLNINNFLIDGDQVQVIDFDDCGYGWFLYDLAYCVQSYEGEELKKAITSWLKGYESCRSLTDADKAEIETFVMMKKIHRFSWIAKHMDSDTAKQIPLNYYERTVRYAQLYYDKYHK